jgi:hypothetical protein
VHPALRVLDGVGTRRSFNAEVCTRLDVEDGRLSYKEYQAPFDDIFNVPEFESELKSGCVVVIRTAMRYGTSSGRCFDICDRRGDWSGVGPVSS